MHYLIRNFLDDGSAGGGMNSSSGSTSIRKGANPGGAGGGSGGAGGLAPPPVAYRARHSVYPIVPVDQALSTILDNCSALPSENVKYKGENESQRSYKRIYWHDSY